jgi:hypothetical protein
MAKKTAAPAAPLVHIPAAAGNSALSKAQKEFNRLTKRIATLEKTVADFRAAATRLRQRVQDEYLPLPRQHNAHRAELVRQLDHAHDTAKLTKGERAKIADLIGFACADLPALGFPEVQPLIDKYAGPPPTEAEDQALDKQASEMMKALFSQQFGIEFDPEADVSTQEKFQAYVDQVMAGREADFEAEEQAREARRVQRKKTPKQQAAEEKKQAEEKNITKAVRMLYLDLVKHLHPDREPDEAEKARKTELLQRVTTAYEASELLTLLRLQLELQRIDQSHLENLAEDQLRYYNKLLKEQARELDEALYLAQMDLSGFTGRPHYYTPTPAAIDYDYQAQRTQLVAKIKKIEANVQSIAQDPAAVKAFLETYKIPKPGLGPLLMPL